MNLTLPARSPLSGNLRKQEFQEYAEANRNEQDRGGKFNAAYPAADRIQDDGRARTRRAIDPPPRHFPARLRHIPVADATDPIKQHPVKTGGLTAHVLFILQCSNYLVLMRLISLS